MKRTGHTLIEMVLSLTILAIIAGSVGSAVLLAGQAKPADDSPTATLVSDSRVLGRITEDLAITMYVLEQSDHDFTIVVPDRTADGIPDRIQYAWSGMSGDPLTFQLNDGAAVTILEKVDQFNLGYILQPDTKTFAVVGGAPGAEELLAEYNSPGEENLYEVKSDKWYTQAIMPTLNADANGYIPTRIEFYAARKAEEDGVSLVAVGGGQGSANYGQGFLYETSLIEDTLSWVSITLSDTDTVPAGQGVFVSVKSDSGRNELVLLNAGAIDPGGLFKSNGDQNWDEEGGKRLNYRLYGKQVTGPAGYNVTHDHLTEVTVSLQSTAEGRSPLTRRIRLERAPEVVGAFWEADFNADPKLMDLNYDDEPDWAYSGGNINNDLTDGVWTANGTLAIAPTYVYGPVIDLELRVNADNGQATLYGPVYVANGGLALPLITTLVPDGRGGQTLNIYNGYSTGDTPVATYAGLDSGWIDLNLTLLPSEDRLWIAVGGQSMGTVELRKQADQGARGFWVQGRDGALYSNVRLTFGGSISELVDEGGEQVQELLEGMLGGLVK